ncbi:GGDEF domain-containing protein [Billgrantia saliphila]|uniref:GGDEF domain-containing protein n=1 Tax=Billgrantia saliphila TaxID=1848458 RepID=UPI000CE3959D|nr:GGDEF domain-containing protein [Halomonas saliphila]
MTSGTIASLDWRIEFRDPVQETLYRDAMRAQDEQQLRHALWLITVVLLAFCAADQALLRSGNALLTLWFIRGAIALSCMVLALAMASRRVRSHLPILVNTLFFLGISGLLLTLPLNPGSTELHISTMLAASTAIYLLVPNRLPWTLAWNAYLAAGFVTVMTLWSPLTPGMLAISLLLLGFVNLTGGLALIRINRLQRWQFALWMEEHELNRKLQSEIEERRLLEAQLRHLASTDPLTGIANRRRFFELAERELSRAQREQSPLAICMVDIDLFKSLNDHHGHAVGDLVLTTVAACCASVLRETDIIGRYGGEEFVIALPQADHDTALQIAERLRAKVTSLRLPMLNADAHLSVTVGISQVEPGETRLEPALQRADEALYSGKARGRNCVMVAGDAPSPLAAQA